MSVASFVQNGSSSSWATTWLTRPIRSASSAPTKLPVKLISRARRTPIASTSRTAPPQPGCSPTRAWVSPNSARSEATRKSQLSAISRPPVIAGPLIAPISGARSGGIGPPRRAASVSARPPPMMPPVAPSSLRSSPAQNAGSAPVRTIASTASSASSSRSAAVRRGDRRGVERVARLGAVERDDGDPVVGGDVDHGAPTMPAAARHRTARRRTTRAAPGWGRAP